MAALSLAVHDARCAPDEVHNAGGWNIPAPPTGQCGSAAELDLFVIHEVRLIEQPDRLEHLAPDHQTRTRDPVGSVRLVPHRQRDDTRAEES